LSSGRAAVVRNVYKAIKGPAFGVGTGLLFHVVVFLVFKGTFLTGGVRLELDKQNKCYFKYQNDNNLITWDLLLITLLARSF
jgi:hypothetical protein